MMIPSELPKPQADKLRGEAEVRRISVPRWQQTGGPRSHGDLPGAEHGFEIEAEARGRIGAG
jgi:hypothetical protein